MNDSTVKCEVCGKTQKVSFGYCLAKGWPLCHGYTMTLISHPTTKQIDTAVKGCIGNAQVSCVESHSQEKP